MQEQHAVIARMNALDATICNKGCILFGRMGYHHLHVAHGPQAHAAAWQRDT